MRTPKHTMVGFANFTHQYDYRLGETPFYQRGAMGKDPLKTFSAQSTQQYRANASRIRKMRFANSNELNADTALRSRREQMISSMYSGSKNPELLVGVHGKLNPQYSRSGGALSSGRPYIKVMKQKKEKKAKAVGVGGVARPPRARSFVKELATKEAEMRMRKGFRNTNHIRESKGPEADDEFIRRGPIVNNDGAGAGAGAGRDSVDPRVLIHNVTRQTVSTPQREQRSDEFEYAFSPDGQVLYSSPSKR